MEAATEAFVVDAAVDVTLFGFGDGSFVPGACLVVVPGLRTFCSANSGFGYRLGRLPPDP